MAKVRFMFIVRISRKSNIVRRLFHFSDSHSGKQAWIPTYFDDSIGRTQLPFAQVEQPTEFPFLENTFCVGWHGYVEYLPLMFRLNSSSAELSPCPTFS